MTVNNLTSLVFVAHLNSLTRKINLSRVKNAASASQKAHCPSITNADKLMMFKEIIVNYCQQPCEDIGRKVLLYTK